MQGQFNVFRKIFHFSGILIAWVYYSNILDNFPYVFFRENTRSLLFYTMILGYLLLGILEFLRFRFTVFQNIFLAVVGRILKPEEINKSHGSLPFFLGLAICIGFFTKEIAIISTLFLLVGDPCAAWFGVKFGKHKLYNGKSYEGLVAGITGSFMAGIIFLILNMTIQPDNMLSLLLKNEPLILIFILLAGAVTAFTVELFSANGFFDDNFLIPVTTALTISFLLIVFFQFNTNELFYSAKDLLIPK